MKRKPIIKPEVNPCFFYGEIVKWDFREKITPTHGKYAFRFTITFSDGTIIPKEKGGYATRKQCQLGREQTVTELNNHEYVAFIVTAKEFFDYWLYYHMIDEVKIDYNTFSHYKGIIDNYILPLIGDKKMTSILRDTLINVLNNIESPSVLSNAYAVIGGAFKYAKSRNLVNMNFALSAIKTKRAMEKKKKRSEGNCKSIKRPTLTLKQILDLFWLCKKKYPDLFLPLIITATTGCRVSELIAIKFTSINIKKGEITIKNQLGRKIDDSDVETGDVYKQTLKPKSHAGERKSAIPEFVVEEILVAKERYDYWKSITPGFQDNGYIWYQLNGRSHGKYDYSKPFNALKSELGLPEDFHWHDLRHSYTTIMVENKANLKELSVALGHYDELLTLNVYTDADQINSHGVPEYDSFIDEILPSDEPQVIDCAFSQSFLDYVLPNGVA